MLDLLFVLVNLIPLPFWFLMIFLPRRQFTRRLMDNYLVFLVLGALYVFTMVGAIVSWVDLGARGSGASINFTTTGGLAAAFNTPAAALVVWVHLVTMDLIGGHWMYHESQRLNLSQIFTSISLLLTFALGPLGIFTFILWRTLHMMQHRGDAAPKTQEQPA
jgi:predicted DNA repair protein MutK